MQFTGIWTSCMKTRRHSDHASCILRALPLSYQTIITTPTTFPTKTTRLRIRTGWFLASQLIYIFLAGPRMAARSLWFRTHQVCAGRHRAGLKIRIDHFFVHRQGVLFLFIISLAHRSRCHFFWIPIGSDVLGRVVVVLIRSRRRTDAYSYTIYITLS